MLKRYRKGFIALGLLLIIALLMLPKFLGSGKKGPDPTMQRGGREGVTPVHIALAREKVIPEAVATVGTILSDEEVEIRSEITGKVDAIPFSEGTRVRKGDLLVKINDDELKARVQAASARLDLATLEEQRLKSLLEKNLISQQEFDRGANAATTATADLQLARAQLSKTSLVAPFDGIVSLRSISPGSYLSPNTLVATLVDDRRVKVDFTLAEKYARKVRRGDKLTFTIQGSDRVFSATVYAITPKIDPATRTIRMRAIAPNPDRALVPGGFANVEFRFRDRTGLIVPAFAVIPELKQYSVFLLRGGRAVSQPVQLGLRMEREVEVISGLAAGDTIITSAILQLRAGERVLPAADDGTGSSADSTGEAR